jgi:hypothetical protein
VEVGQGKLVKQVLAAAGLLWATTAYAQPGTASGTITVNGRAFALRHAYASVQPGAFDPKTEDIRVLLTDVPLEEPIRTDMSALTRLARRGQLHAVEVVIDAKGETMSGSIFLDAFTGMASVSGVHQFDKKAMERALIAGRLFMDGSRTFGGVTYHYDATFSASIVRPPTAEETAAALKSPAGLAAAAHLNAIRNGFDAFVGTLTEKAAAAYRSPGGVDRFLELRAETPADSRVVSLTEGPDDTRIATVQGKRGGIVIEASFKLRREGTAWKVDR